MIILRFADPPLFHRRTSRLELKRLRGSELARNLSACFEVRSHIENLDRVGKFVVFILVLRGVGQSATMVQWPPPTAAALRTLLSQTRKPRPFRAPKNAGFRKGTLTPDSSVCYNQALTNSTRCEARLFSHVDTSNSNPARHIGWRPVRRGPADGARV